MNTLHVSYSTITQFLTAIPSFYTQYADGSYVLYAVGTGTIYISTIPDNVGVSDFQNNYQAKCTAVNSEDDAFVLGSIANAVPFVTPAAPDGRPNVLPSLFPNTMQLCFPGSGDDPVHGIGKGTLFQHTSNDVISGPTTHTVAWNFNDWVYLSGGHIVYQGAVLGDTLNYYLVAPATSITTVSGTGNVNCVGPGNVMIVPGNNTNTQMNLATAVPVPSPTNTGYWNWTPAANNIGNGTLTPNATGTGAYNLYTIPITLGEFVINYPILGSNYIDLTVPAILPKKILPQWQHQVQINNSGHDGLQVIWALTIARQITVGM